MDKTLTLLWKISGWISSGKPLPAGIHSIKYLDARCLCHCGLHLQHMLSCHMLLYIKWWDDCIINLLKTSSVPISHCSLFSHLFLSPLKNKFRKTGNSLSAHGISPFCPKQDHWTVGVWRVNAQILVNN